MRLATEADVKAMFFDEQPEVERRLKEKKFGPALAKTAKKASRDAKGARAIRKLVNDQVIVRIAPEDTEKRDAVERKSDAAAADDDGDGDDNAPVVVVDDSSAVVVVAATDDDKNNLEHIIKEEKKVVEDNDVDILE